MSPNQNNNGVSETKRSESLGNGKASEQQTTTVESIAGSSMQGEIKSLGTGVTSSSGIHSSSSYFVFLLFLLDGILITFTCRWFLIW